MDLQPNSLSAMELIANEPIRLIHGRKTACDGGKSATKPRDGIFLTVEGLRFFPPLPLFFFFSLSAGAGPLGHPKIYINLVRVKRETWDGLLTFLSDRTSLVPSRAGELTSI